MTIPAIAQLNPVQITPSAGSFRVASPRQQEIALRHAVKTSKRKKVSTSSCFWVMAANDRLIYHGTFDASGMAKDEVNRRVALESLEYLIKSGFREIILGINHLGVRRHVMSVAELVPDITIMDSSINAVTAALDLRAREEIAILENPQLAKKLEQKKRRYEDEVSWLIETTVLSTIGLSADSPSRTIYSDASVFNSDGSASAGYVIRDAEPSGSGGDGEWSLKFGSGRTRTSLKGSSELAELRAMCIALWDPSVLTPDVKAGLRTLTVVCDNQHAIDSLIAAQRGTATHHSCMELPEVVAVIADIMEAIRGLDRVEFVWVKGHGKDILNRASHALATYERKYGLASKNPDEAMKTQIVDRFMRDMRMLGVNPVLMA